MSQLFDKEINAQKESLIKKLSGFTQAPACPQKVCDENERNKYVNKKKQRAHKNVFDGRKAL